MTRRAQHEIIFHGARGGCARTLPGKSERFAFGEIKRVAPARQSDKTFECVPAVGAAAGHMQSQIDFRGRAFGEGLGQDGSRGQSSSEANHRQTGRAVRLAISRTALRGTLPVHPAGASAPVFFRFGLSRGWMRLLVEAMFNLV